jgi:hypothetical protein
MSGQPEAHCLLPLLYLPGAELAPARASGGIYGSKPGVQAVLRLRAELLSGLWKKPGRQFDSIERSPKSWRTTSRWGVIKSVGSLQIGKRMAVSL